MGGNMKGQTNRSRTSLRVGIVALALAAAGCSSVKGELSAPPEEAPPVTLQMADGPVEEAPTDPEAAAGAFAFEAPELYGNAVVSGAELYQNSPAIITFVSPTCPVCVEEGPKLANAAEDNPDINYVVVHSFGDREMYLDYNDASALGQENVIHIVDHDGVLWDRFGVSAQPSTVLIDSEGQLSSSRGALQDDGLVRAAEFVTSG